MKTIDATEARERLMALMDEVTERDEPIQINHGASEVVMMSEAHWRGLQETLYLVSIPGMRESLLEAMAEDRETFVTKIDWGDDPA